MISKIELHNAPPYLGEKQIIEPKKVNFIFGLNGSGKTTLSRFIRCPEKKTYPDCHLHENEPSTECAVYNNDYVQENFSESSMPGIFTLGEENIETKKQIETLNREIKELKDRKRILNESIEGSGDSKGLKTQLHLLEGAYTDKFWSMKQNLDKEKSPLLFALEGVRGSKEAFKNKLLQQMECNSAEVLDKTSLEKLCDQLFGKDNEKLPTISLPSFEPLIQYEQNALLSKVVVGKADVDIAGLIRELGNDAWFRQGVTYAENSKGKCPFCQKPLDDDFSEKVAEYFDQTYTAAVEEISKILSEYSQNSIVVLSQIESLIKNKTQFSNPEDIERAYQQLKDATDANVKRLSEKKLSPNISITLNPIQEIGDTILRVLNDTNQAIIEFNNRIDHIKEERAKTTSLVWKHILETLSAEIASYQQEKNLLNAAITQATDEIKSKDNSVVEKSKELHSLEQRLTSVLPTATGINSLLSNYGFTGFSLKVDDEGKSYQFIRTDGVPAYNSLSEGERNFVTFLYFMYSLKGNTDESGHNNDKIVVVDDPVSSLDNDVLFLVSSLLRDLFRSIYDGSSSIKQLFILSHNLYFFKEVSFDKGLKKRETGYWMITKTKNISRVTPYEKNPVSSTYEMLWDEVRSANTDPEHYNATALANTMRRILEHYFKFLGGIDLSQFHLCFPDGERQVFKSLIAWANAGSHSEFDDYSATPNIYSVENYLKVFKDLFDKTKHTAHYNMMMRLDMEEN